MKKSFSVLFLLLLLLSGGCFNLPSPMVPATRTYDVNPIVSGTFSVPAEILPFTSDSPARSKMLYNLGHGELSVDEYSKWAQSPAAMLTRYFRAAFQKNSVPGKRGSVKIRGNILTFEADVAERKVVLSVSYAVTERERGNAPVVRTVPVTTIVPMKSMTSEAYAEAMAKAFAAQTVKVRAFLSK